MNSKDSPAEAEQWVYTKATLSAYDVAVLGFSCRYVWRCPARRIEALYNDHVTANHLEVGVGTGYFLERCRWPSRAPRIALLDINPNALAYASRRLARYKPDVYRHNLLEPIPWEGSKFDSVGINAVLHCIPGSMETKANALDHLKALMNPGAVLFGSSVLYDGVSKSWFAKRLMNVYNRAGIFSNRQDDLDGLNRALAQRFRDVAVDVVGCLALFSGRA